MRVIEGTPKEIAEYLRLMEVMSGATDSDIPAEGEVDVAEISYVGGDMTWSEIDQLVRDRGRDPETINRVLEFLRRAVELEGVEIGPGTSERTKDGRSDYIMVRDAGKRRFGAVVYVKATNGGLTLRLTKEDIADLDDGNVKLRDVRAGHQYVVNCPLHSEEAIDRALELTEIALKKVRA